jgi:nicotinamidase-related amidase
MQHAFGLDIPETLAEVCDPARTALLVYDMQVGVLRQLPDPATVTARVAAVLQIARQAGVRTFFTRHLYLPLPVAGVSQLRTAMIWQRVSNVAQVQHRIPPGSSDFQLVPEVTPLTSEAVFDKIALSAFVGTPLDQALRDCGIRSIVIVGVALEVGIWPTVSHATDLGYIPVVVVDACGVRDQAAAQRALDMIAFMGTVPSTESATLAQVWGAQAH